MIPMSSDAPPIETRILTFFACAAAASAFTSASAAPRLQSLVPALTTPKAKLRCVILLKSIFVAHVEKLPLQFGKYMTTLVSAVPLFPADPSPMPLPETPPPSDVVAPPPSPGFASPASAGIGPPASGDVLPVAPPLVAVPHAAPVLPLARAPV